MKVFKFFTRKANTPNFFDLPAREQKKILDHATKSAVKMQKDLLKRYEYTYGSTD
jgi:hypothetical protein